MVESADNRLVGRVFDESDYTTWSAIAIATAVKAGRVRPRELVAHFIQRLEQVNPLVNAVIAWSADAIYEQAEALEARLAGKNLAAMPLAGVPVLVKDNIWVEGWEVTQGSQLLLGVVAPKDALVVARLRASGAIILGLTNCPEFACRSITTNSVYGTTRNPWALTHTPGGSSGGSASAVAAGLAPLALGTDAGGSIRRPAAHTGIIGMMPAAGTVPFSDSFPELPLVMNSMGIFARTLADTRLALETMRGLPVDLDGPITNPAEGSGRGAGPLRIGYCQNLGMIGGLEPDVENAVRTALNRLLAQGSVVMTETAPDWMSNYSESGIAVLEQTGLALLFGEDHLDNPGLIDADVAKQIDSGLNASGLDVARALVLRESLTSQFNSAFQNFDLLVTPTTPCTAWPLSEDWPRQIAGRSASPRDHARFTWFVNQVGAAACSMPCGFDAEGLPIGLQVIAPAHAEADLLALAEMLEADYALHLPATGA
ncbi:amidase [Allohahella marinimesophila]|uniref:Amidase n=1 Tax=Allohahella marinimesophila TaxID=1054972 RepID=A0ABP7NT58_9GAMM